MIEVVASPCIDICRLNARQVCIGCGRTGNEIAEWLGASNARRAAIVLEARARLNAMQPTLPVVPHE
jgi:predicted Fe-S protein YdhL (DUF1289 family)